MHRPMSERASPPDGSAEAAGPAERFNLQVAPVFGPRFFVTVASAVALVAILFSRPLLESGEVSYLVALLVLSAVVPAVVAVLVATGRQRRRLSIEVLPDRVNLPTGGPGFVPVRYRDLTALFLQKGALGGFLYISTAEREMIFPLRLFSADDAERLFRALRQRIAGVEPDGPRRLDAIDRMAKVADRAYGRRPVVTWAAVLVMGLVHLFLLSTGRLDGALSVAGLGAASPELAEAAGPYVAFTSNWVHGWRFQPLLVLPGFFVVGTLVERLLGHGVAAATLLLSATVGGLAAAYYPGSTLQAGALVPAAGLAGTLAFTAQRYRGRMPLGFRLSGPWWAWVGTLGAVAALVHGVSVPAVALALLAGVAVAAWVLDDDPELPLAFSPSALVPASAVLASLHVGAVGWALVDLPGRGPELERIVAEAHGDARRLHELSWQVATSAAEPSEEQLELALLAAERSVRLEKNALLRLVYKDGLATVHHRAGRAEEAARIERAVLEERPESVTAATQLARFIESAPEPLVPEALRAMTTTVRLDEGESLVAFIELSEPLEQPHILYAPLRAEGQLAGLLRVPLAAHTRSSSVAVESVGDRKKAEVEVRPGYVVPGRASGKVWPAAPGFLDFP